MSDGDRVRLIQEAAEAMRAAGRIPELAVLMALPDEHLRAIVDYHTGPKRVHLGPRA
jgi:hypothetical protein